MQNNQKNLHELKELLTEMRNTLKAKESELERLSSKENEFVEQIKTLNKENVCLKEKITKKNEEVNKLRQDELFKVKAHEESFSDVELVKYKEVAHLAPIIQFWFQVFEEKAFKVLFEGSKHVSISQAEKAFKEKLRLEEIDAFLLARYVIEPREQATIILQLDRTAYRREILSKLKSIAFKKITEKDFHALEDEIRSEENKHCRQKFYDEMQDLAFLDVITKDDIVKIISEVGIKLNTHVLLVLLCRESKDM